MTIEIEDLPAPLQFAYLSMTRTAIHFKEIGQDKDFFVNFAREIWNSMEMTDLQSLKDILEEKMEQDIKPYVDKYIKDREKEKNHKK